MTLRRCLLVVVLASVFTSMGAAQHRTQNFDVHAPNKEIAQQVGQWAEYYRKVKAVEWLGQEMPNWPQPCPLYVTITMDGPSGATSFEFGRSHPLVKMEIQGPLDRLLASVLPHEITHTVFAHYFRRPVPRWADEGGSVLSEDDLERDRHDKIVRGILNRSGQFPLRQLFTLPDYPRSGEKVMCLYAQGFSVSHYLVYTGSRQTFLRFVQQGLQTNNWDNAVQTCYGLRSVEELEAAWLKFERDTKGQSPSMLAKAKEKGNQPAFTTTAIGTQPGYAASGSNVVRLTVPPSDPLQPVPVVRGAMPDQQKFEMPAVKPGYLPEYMPSTSPQGWQPPPQGQPAQPYYPAAGPSQYRPIGVQLGAPAYPQPAPVVPGSVSPVGFPR
jgi:hypothetical protein